MGSTQYNNLLASMGTCNDQVFTFAYTLLTSRGGRLHASKGDTTPGITINVARWRQLCYTNYILYAPGYYISITQIPTGFA